jgi:hypothetical protein
MGLTGCSGDTQRVTTVSSDAGTITNLSTNTDGTSSDDGHSYDGFPYTEEVEEEFPLNGTPEDRFDNDTPNLKPRDNGPVD